MPMRPSPTRAPAATEGRAACSSSQPVTGAIDDMWSVPEAVTDGGGLGQIGRGGDGQLPQDLTDVPGAS